MKKLLSLTLALLMIVSLFAACRRKEDTPDEINVYTLNGTTGFGMAKLMNDQADDKIYDITVKTDASEVSAALINGDVDIAALPTNAAANVFNKTNGGVKILAVNTLGCLYLLTKEGTTVTRQTGEVEWTAIKRTHDGRYQAVADEGQNGFTADKGATFLASVYEPSFSAS